jgi:phospholipase/carboxylesterase
MHSQLRQIGNFEALKLERNPLLPWVVLFHGYGASAHDLFPLASLIDTEKSYNWIFPQAPLISHPQMGEVRSWFNLDVEELVSLNQSLDFDRFIYEEPSSLNDCSKLLNDFFKKTNIKVENCIIGGFSQGALLSTHYLLNSLENFKALMIFSGSVTFLNKWREALKTKTPVPYFQSHGLHDDILHADVAKKLHNELQDSNWKGDLHLFEGGHEIPFHIQNKARTFLNSLS